MGVLERARTARRFGGGHGQSIGKTGQNDQRIGGKHGRCRGVLLAADGTAYVDFTGLAEQPVERRAMAAGVEAGVRPTRLQRGVDRKVVAIKLDQIGADDERRLDGRTPGGTDEFMEI